MKKLTQILEYRTTDIIKIYFGSKEITSQRSIFDEESLNEFINFYKNNEQILKNYELRLCKLNNNKWKVLKGVCNINLLNLNKFLTHNNKSYNQEDLIKLLDSSQYLLILIKKENH